MKVRTGFVSNSSSSSFVLFYKATDLDNADEIYAIGKYLYEGDDYFKVTPEMRALIVANQLGGLRFIKPFYVVGDDERVNGKTFKAVLPDDDFYIEVLKLDYHATENFDDFVERYVEGF